MHNKIFRDTKSAGRREKLVFTSQQKRIKILECHSRRQCIQNYFLLPPSGIACSSAL
uniref:Uncharacterized protein n=1 Tax=Arundo donax TaxID=35708 RepID=A0A0A9HGG0_ARUDO